MSLQDQNWIPLTQGEPILGEPLHVILRTGFEVKGELVRDGDAFYVDAGPLGRFGLSRVVFWRRLCDDTADAS